MSKDKERFPLFSNGTEAEIWVEHNCCRCIKGTFYNEARGNFPKYRCAIQKHIEEAWMSDGKGNKRTHDVVSQFDCKHIKTTWPKRKPKKELTLNLFWVWILKKNYTSSSDK